MEQENVEGFLKSRTTQMCIAILAAYAVKTWGVPFAPAELQVALTEVLSVSIPVMVLGVMWFRKKAQTIIQGWW